MTDTPAAPTTRSKSAIALDRLMAVINERTTIEPRHRSAIRASLRAYRRAIEDEIRSTPAEALDVTPELANAMATEGYADRARPMKRRIRRLHEMRSRWGDCAWRPSDGAGFPDAFVTPDPCEELEPDFIEYENDVRADFVEQLRSTEARSTPAEALDVEQLRVDIIEVLHRYECDEEPPGHDWREHLPEDEPNFGPNRIDGLVDLFIARLSRNEDAEG